MCETYRYSDGERLPCPIAAVGGLHDPLVSQEELTAWSEQTSASFTLRMAHGDHFFLNTAQSFLPDMIAEGLQDFLQQKHRDYNGF
jgi:medium-chain acyl-[acyl-carrier-protein] hydrolase